MFLTKAEKNVLDLQENLKRSRKMAASQSEQLTGKKITVKNMHSVNTKVFIDINEALDTFIKYYPLFQTRAVKNAPELKTKLNTLNRMISKSVRDKK